MKKLMLSVAAAGVLSTGCFAGGDIVPVPVEEYSWYVGGAGAIMSTYADKLDWFNVTAGQDRTGGIVALVGYEFNPYIAIEGRFNYGAFTGDISKNCQASIFLKPMYPVTEDFTVYGLLGYGYVNIDGNHGYPNWLDKGSFEWGLGLSYDLDEEWTIFADYDWLLHDEQANASFDGKGTNLSHEAITIGALYHF